MRLALLAISLVYAASAAAQVSDRPLPTQKPPSSRAKAPLQPVPEPPPPPAGFELDPSLEPQVTIQKRGAETVEEFRMNGRLYAIKVTPAHGVPYYLIDDVGRGDFVRRDNFDTRTRPPMWVIKEW